MIREAQIGDLEQLLPLFSAYRTFYQQPIDPVKEREFLKENIEKRISTLFIKVQEDKEKQIVGFVQLYVSRCSLTLSKIYYLYDLYVAEEERRKGVAKELLHHVKEFAAKNGASRIELQTVPTNIAAKSLYELEGYRLDLYQVYSLLLQKLE